MRGENISWNGSIATPDKTELSFSELLTAHYIYQRVHVQAGKILHLDEHLTVVKRAFWSIHRTQPQFDEASIMKEVVALLRSNRYSAYVDATVMLCFFPKEEGYERLIMCERPLIENGYAVSSLRPVAITDSYRLPYEGFQTNFLLSAAKFHDDMALRHGATKSIRREGEWLLGCGDATLFGIRGKTLFTAPLTDGAVGSVERKLVITSVSKSGLDFLEEAIPYTDLTLLDELFYADAAGITSLAECDGVKFMSLLVHRLIKHF